ncbi:Beta-lactamase-related domain-containing protein [Caenorhabditis elegans]|uniref:Beta-lactamase-related domain-containing protein n=1 Tax=Caenorhabditis elegans TaxID=6239 RepID=Q20489_CAEEL|nr:Beta-lactamase-related domain-containing protein [Caenorhabditis elegans]CCD71362.1 Beta-lactamase-related domain-containing protein [Caenorhabditis elegans]|eukprot:NP_509221.2 beta-LACTamase domain containing [Caenorhabditis elegans]
MPGNNIGGFAQSEYDTVKTVFRENFEKGLETAGASFAVYHNDKLLINLYGGLRNVDKKQPWVEDTTSVIFSTTKSISAVILAYCIDKNKEGINYETKISEIWPDFSNNGKENITILDAALHRAGLAYTEEVLEREDITKPAKISKFFEEAVPMTNGSDVLYHALTFGLLLDQIVRRIDEKRRGIAEILNEDFVHKYGIKNLSIGLKCENSNENVAKLTDLNNEEIERQGLLNPEALRKFIAGDNIHHQKLYSIFPWITTDDYNLVSNRLLPMPSNMGISNAEGLAHFHSLVANKQILSENMYRLLKQPVLEHVYDHAIGYEENKGYGFQYTKNPKGQWIFGHSGFGGQNVRVDVTNGLTLAYVSNGMKITDADMVEPWKNLIEETYRVFFHAT